MRAVRGNTFIPMRTSDRGETWQDVVALKPANGPEASYSALFNAPFGRIYSFCTHNTGTIRNLVVDDEHRLVHRRLDLIGHFVFRFSGDHGRTWSEKRYNVPIRTFEIDRSKPMGDEVLFFWNVGRALVRDGSLGNVVAFSAKPGMADRAQPKRPKARMVWV